MQVLRQHAAETAKVLKLLANENRLLILCHLVDRPRNVSQLNSSLPFLSQSALSQHLARLRQAGLVQCEAQGHTMLYFISDARVKQLLYEIRDIYCRPPDLAPGAGQTQGL